MVGHAEPMRILVWLLLSFSVLCNTPCLLSAADKVRITTTNLNMTSLTAGVAVKRGFFRDEGLEVEVIRTTAPVTVAALSNGDIDYTMVFGSVVRAAMRGLPLKVVASFVDSSSLALVARPEIKTMKDLRGKTLGVSAYGATTDVVARLMIRHFDIDPEKEIKVIALGADRARLSALKEGLIHVAAVSPPVDFEGKSMGFVILARAYELFNFPFHGLATHNRKIKERPDEVKRVLKAMIKASRFIRENREKAIEVLMQWARVDRDQAVAAYDSDVRVLNPHGTIPEDGLRLVIEQASKEARITREFSASDVSDQTILQQVQRELGISGR
jgi:ABC-type nitrate/sulfonate/bicarbonate transport system substrate-binding protein